MFLTCTHWILNCVCVLCDKICPKNRLLHRLWTISVLDWCSKELWYAHYAHYTFLLLLPCTLPRLRPFGPVSTLETSRTAFSPDFQSAFYFWIYIQESSWEVVFLPSCPHDFLIVIYISQYPLQCWFISITPWSLHCVNGLLLRHTRGLRDLIYYYYYSFLPDLTLTCSPNFSSKLEFLSPDAFRNFELPTLFHWTQVFWRVRLAHQIHTQWNHHLASLYLTQRHVTSTADTGSWTNSNILKMTVYWDVAPCSLVETGRSFRCIYCLHRLGDDSYAVPIKRINKLRCNRYSSRGESVRSTSVRSKRQGDQRSGKSIR
jgi:hypothetical protein